MSESPELPENALSARQLAAIPALLTAPSISAAAETLGINERTLRRWHKQPAFALALRLATDELWASLAKQLQSKASLAVETLADVCQTGDKDAARVGAARWLLELSMKMREQLDLAARLERLEEAVKGGEYEL
jgi:hypothetical protein